MSCVVVICATVLLFSISVLCGVGQCKSAHHDDVNTAA